ncbi:unnamed protein product, partial [Staurois parvus]
MPVNAHQCHLSVLPISGTYQCQSVPPISASQRRLSMCISAAYQCQSSVLPISAAYQCHISVPCISAAFQCPSVMPVNAHQCHLPVPPHQCPSVP